MQEHRKYPRFSIMVDLILTVNNTRHEVIGFDFCRGGISFISDKSIETSHEMEIYEPHTKFNAKGKFVPANITGSYPGAIKYGMSFNDELPIDVFSSLLQSFKLETIKNKDTF